MSSTDKTRCKYSISWVGKIYSSARSNLQVVGLANDGFFHVYCVIKVENTKPSKGVLNIIICDLGMELRLI